MEENLTSLTKLYERRQHELKTIGMSLRQKSNEVQPIFQACGRDCDFCSIQTVLAEKLAEAENGIHESRTRIKELRNKKSALVEDKNKAELLLANANETRRNCGSIKDSIASIQKEIETVKQKILMKKEKIGEKEVEIVKQKSEMESLQQNENDSSKKMCVQMDNESTLQNQLEGLKKSIFNSKQTLKEIQKEIDSNKIASLQSEYKNLTEQLNQANVYEININDSVEPEDLSPIYKEQINSLTEKIEKLKQSVNEIQNCINDENQKYKLEMSDLRLKLSNLKYDNNILRSNIEEVESSIPQSIGPLNRELDSWRKKVENASQKAKEDEIAIQQKCNESESILEDIKNKNKSIKRDVANIKASISQQGILNENKKHEINLLNKEILSLKQNKDQIENKLQEILKQIEETSAEEEKLKAKLKQYEDNFPKEDPNKEIKEQIQIIQERIKKLPSNNIETTQMNEDEIVQSVRKLEKEYDNLQTKIKEIRVKHEEYHQMKEKIEAAIRLISDLEEEETYLKDELKMVQEQFAETLQQLHESKNQTL